MVEPSLRLVKVPEMGVTDVLFNAVKNCSQREGTDAEISQGKKCAIKGYAVRHNSVSRDGVAVEIQIEDSVRITRATTASSEIDGNGRAALFQQIARSKGAI